MATYYVYHGASSSADPYGSWDAAALSLEDLDDAKTLAVGDIIYIASDHVDPETAAADRTFTAPTTGPGHVKLISANRTTTAYEAGTTAQIDTSDGAYKPIFSGLWALYGVKIVSGGNITFTPGTSGEGFYAESCSFAPAANGAFAFGTAGATYKFINCVIDLTADGTTNRSGVVISSLNYGTLELYGITFTNAGYRTNTCIYSSDNHSLALVSACDFSGFTQCTSIAPKYGSYIVATNCLLPSGKTFLGTGSDSTGTVTGHIITNCGSTDSPTYLSSYDFRGYLNSSTSIYRDTGATVEGTSTGWQVVTTSKANEQFPHYTPWIYGTISATGTKTFTMYTAGAADRYDNELWLEIEIMETSGSPKSTRYTDRRATVTDIAVLQDDDTLSSWQGSPGSYLQKLEIASKTVGEAGLFRARVACAKASTTFYIDPKVTVS